MISRIKTYETFQVHTLSGEICSAGSCPPPRARSSSPGSSPPWAVPSSATNQAVTPSTLIVSLLRWACCPYLILQSFSIKTGFSEHFMELAQTDFAQCPQTRAAQSRCKSVQILKLSKLLPRALHKPVVHKKESSHCT